MADEVLVSMKRLFAVNTRFAFLGRLHPASAPFPKGIEAEGFGGKQPPRNRRFRTGSLCHPFMDEPRSTYPFGLHQTDEANSSRRRVPQCRIRAAAHVGRRRCCRARPRLTPTQLQPATLEAALRPLRDSPAGVTVPTCCDASATDTATMQRRVHAIFSMVRIRTRSLRARRCSRSANSSSSGI